MVDSRVKRRRVPIIPAYPPAKKSVEVGAHHRTPVVEIMEEDGLKQQKFKAKTRLPFLGGTPGAPDAEEEREHADFGQRIVALHHLPANFQPEIPIKQFGFD